MNTKSMLLQLKAIGDGTNDLADGEFTAYAAIFGNKDSYGDVIVKGAFTETLLQWKAGSNPIPVYWAHQMSSDPDFNIGYLKGASEDDRGLLVHGVLDTAENAKAATVHRLMKGGRVAQLSFAYDVLEGGVVETDSSDLGPAYYELRKLKLHEVSIVPVGANQETEVLAVKAAAELVAERAVVDVKAGRVLSAKNLASLKGARDALDAVISAQEVDDTVKAPAAPPAAPPTSATSNRDYWDTLIGVTAAL